jgi:hypothetical protein
VSVVIVVGVGIGDPVILLQFVGLEKSWRILLLKPNL